MKISGDMQYKDLPQHVTEHLNFLSPTDIKFIISAFTFILLDICLLPLLYPMVPVIYYLTIPFLVFIHLWLIRLLFKNPYSIQSETILFLGSLGAVGTICYFVLTQKIAYVNLGINSTVYYVVSAILFAIIVFAFVRYQIQKYATIKDKADGNHKDNKKKYGLIIVLAPVTGYLIAQNTKNSDVLMYSILLMVALLFTVVMAYFAAKFLHKYFFMKANAHLVIYPKPSKKDRMRIENKGVVIK